MALRGLKGGGYVTYKALESVGLTDADVAGKTKSEVDGMIIENSVSDYDTVNALLINAIKANLTDDDLKTIDSITASTPEINERLREGAKLTKTEQKKISKIDEALQKLPTWKGKTFRNIYIDEPDVPAFLSSYNVGNIVTFPAYSSTSVHEKGTIAGNIEMVITAKGKKSRAILGLSKYTAKDEREVLFERNASFRIKSITPKTDHPFFYDSSVPAGTKKQANGARIELEEV